MLWQEDEPERIKSTVQTVIDLNFNIHCRELPLDHAYALSQAIQRALPWIIDEPLAGIHLIHGAESGNGWYRPDELGAILCLSRRTKLTLRLPTYCKSLAIVLSGMTLEVGHYQLQIGKVTEKPLMVLPVLFARHVIADETQDEETFLQHAVTQLKQQNIHCRKILCGKTSTLTIPQGYLFTRSVMVADLKPQESLLLQQQGLGEGRIMGCGLFIPHKDIKPVNQDSS
jgi:CRISPR-associated protein Cas6